MKSLILIILLLFAASAWSMPMTKDARYCFSKPNLNEYADVALCFSLETTTTWPFGTTSWGMQGLAWW